MKTLPTYGAWQVLTSRPCETYQEKRQIIQMKIYLNGKFYFSNPEPYMWQTSLPISYLVHYTVLTFCSFLSLVILSINMCALHKEHTVKCPQKFTSTLCPYYYYSTLHMLVKAQSHFTAQYGINYWRFITLMTGNDWMREFTWWW